MLIFTHPSALHAAWASLFHHLLAGLLPLGVVFIWRGYICVHDVPKTEKEAHKLTTEVGPTPCTMLLCTYHVLQSSSSNVQCCSSVQLSNKINSSRLQWSSIVRHAAGPRIGAWPLFSARTWGQTIATWKQVSSPWPHRSHSGDGYKFLLSLV